MQSRIRLAALLVGVVTLSPSLMAQTPATREVVEIRAQAPVAQKTPSSEASSARRTATVRDPFVKLVEEHTAPLRHHNPTSHTPPPATPATAENPPAPATPTPASVPTPPTPAPEVTVQGILESAQGNQAIISSPKQTYLVRRGDKLGDFVVDSIEAKVVTLRHQDKTFAIKMTDQFTAMAGKTRKK